MTVTGTASPFSSNNCVIPSFLPKIVFIPTPPGNADAKKQPHHPYGQRHNFGGESKTILSLLLISTCL